MKPLIKTSTTPTQKGAIIGLLLLITFLVSGGSWFYLEKKNSLRQEAINNLTAIAHLKADQIAAWRADVLADAASLLEDKFLKQRLIELINSPDHENTERVRTRLQIQQNKRKYVDTIVVDAKGAIHLDLIEGAGSEHPEMAASLYRSFSEHKPVMSDFHKRSAHSSPHLLVVAPFFSGEGQEAKPAGAIIFICDAEDFLYPLITSWPVPTQTAETLLIQRDGNDALFLNELLNYKNAALSLRIPLTRTDVPAVMAILGKTGVMEGTDYRGARVISILQPIADSPWFMIAKVDSAEALATMKRELIFILVIITGLVAFTVSIGITLWQQDQKRYFRKRFREEQQHGIILSSIGDGVIVTDLTGKIQSMNRAAEELIGWTQAEANARPLDGVFCILNEETRQKIDDPVTTVLQTGNTINLANHSLLIARNGTEIPIVDSGSPIKDERGEISGVVLIFRDHTKERLTERLIQIRLAIIEYSTNHCLDELLTYCLDEISAVVASPIGFFHIVESDQKTLSLQQWSTRTRNEFCRAEGKGLHYSIDQAGIWVDCVRRKKPVIHNDYESLSQKKGLPPGHAPIIRELVVPVFREDSIVAILGVGNKLVNYTESDAEIISYLADVTWEAVKQKRAQAMTEQLLSAIEQAGEMIYVTDAEGNIQYVNPAGVAITGYTREEVLGKNPRIFKSGQQDAAFYQDMFATLSKGKKWEGRMVNKRKNGSLYTEDATISPVMDNSGKIINYVAVKHDITEKLKIEAQLMQAQKMESVGRLAGGIAHDYNNMLSIIVGYSELAKDKIDPTDPLYEDLDEIFKAGVRSAEITRQLLAFARQQTIAPISLNLNEAVEGMLKMLGRLIGEDIDIAWLPKAELWPVKIDPTQLDQLLANLCVNSRDAIKGVGKVTIETGNVSFDAAYCESHPGFISGDYVLLAVSDNGCGMDHETVNKIFEPFFTTKGVGQGTGLGLATVYGIVKQNGGFINVYSEPGKGTTFKIYLARHTETAIDIPVKDQETLPTGQGEIILVVEDEASILKYAKRILEELNYTAITASTPGEALVFVEGGRVEINLLITDVVMPEMNGKELSNRLGELCPGLKTLFMSGYTANVIAHHGVLDEGVKFIQKPFSQKEMAIKVRELLD